MKSFLATSNEETKTDICLKANMFDQFLMKRIDQKVLTRLTLLFSLLNVERIFSKHNVILLSTKILDETAILCQKTSFL